MNVLQNYREARIRLKANGSSEHANSEAIEDLFTEAQTLIAEMNQAKLRAMKEAEAPFLDRLSEIDRELSFFVTLVG